MGHVDKLLTPSIGDNNMDNRNHEIRLTFSAEAHMMRIGFPIWYIQLIVHISIVLYIYYGFTINIERLLLRGAYT